MNLRGGGSIKIEQTEALIAIDVNSGRAIRKDPTTFARNINLKATKTIAEQILLRDLSGIIVIDYIEMSDPQDSEAILEAMTSALAGSKSAIDILPINAFGLMHITRQRKAQPLWEKQLTFCTSCSGKGSILGLSVQAHDLVRDCALRPRLKFGSLTNFTTVFQVNIQGF